MAHKTINNEELPYNISMRKAQYRGPWKHGKSDYHSVKGYYPHKIIYRILDNFIGKSVNDAFSYYCKLVPKYQQKFFWNEISPSIPLVKKWNYYKIDENNLVQFNQPINEYKGPYSFKSKYYEELWTKKIEYLTYSELLSLIHKSVFYKLPETYDNFYRIPWQLKNQYECKIVKGEILYFDSKNNPILIRLKSEKNKLKRKEKRELDYFKKIKQYSFLTKSEKEIIENRKNDIVNRDRHGFDNMSFKNRKTN